MKRDPLPAHVLATRIIPNVAPDMAKELGLTLTRSPWPSLLPTATM